MLKNLIAQASTLKDLAAQLRAKCDRLRAVDADAKTEHARLLKGDLRHFPAEHRRKVLDDLKAEMLRPRQPAASIARFHCERLQMKLEPQIRQFKESARQPLDVESAFLRWTNKPGLSLETTLSLRVLSELVRMRATAELKSASPAARLARYRQAASDPYEPTNATTLTIFDEMTAADAFLPAGNESELPDTMELRRMVEAARDARVPSELADLEQVIVEARKAIARATMQRVEAVNPDADPVAAGLAAEADEAGAADQDAV